MQSIHSWLNSNTHSDFSRVLRVILVTQQLMGVGQLPALKLLVDSGEWVQEQAVTVAGNGAIGSEIASLIASPPRAADSGFSGAHRPLQEKLTVDRSVEVQ